MRSILKGTALAFASVALLGCATTADSAKEAAGLSLPSSKDVPEEQAAKPLNLDKLPTDIDAAIKQAQAQRKAGDLTGAVRLLSQMMLVAPDDPRVLGEYGKTLVAQGRSDDALAFLQRAMELQPAEWSIYSAQGVAYDQKGQYQIAQALYARALALKPGEPSVLSNNALSHMQAGDLDEAERLLRQAAQNGGDDYPRIASNLALVQSLRASRASASGAPNAVVQEAPAPAPDAAPVAAQGASQPSSTPPPATQMAPASAPPVAQVSPTAPTPTGTAPVQGAVAAPVSKTELPVPQATPEQPKPVQQAGEPAPLSGAEALRNNPTVRMQAVPKDSKAGPVLTRTASPAPVPQAADSALLRPALSEKSAALEANASR